MIYTGATKPSWQLWMNLLDEQSEAQRDEIEDSSQAAASIEGTASAFGSLGLVWVIVSCRLGGRQDRGQRPSHSKEGGSSWLYEGP